LAIAQERESTRKPVQFKGRRLLPTSLKQRGGKNKEASLKVLRGGRKLKCTWAEGIFNNCNFSKRKESKKRRVMGTK